MSSSIWVVECDETDSRCCIGVFKTRKAMLKALDDKYKEIEIYYKHDGTPYYARVWYQIATYRYHMSLDLTRMKLDEWNEHA